VQEVQSIEELKRGLSDAEVQQIEREELERRQEEDRLKFDRI
jgi:hypothetical protein